MYRKETITVAISPSELKAIISNDLADISLLGKDYFGNDDPITKQNRENHNARPFYGIIKEKEIQLNGSGWYYWSKTNVKLEKVEHGKSILYITYQLSPFFIGYTLILLGFFFNPLIADVKSFERSIVALILLVINIFYGLWTQLNTRKFLLNCR